MRRCSVLLLATLFALGTGACGGDDDVSGGSGESAASTRSRAQDRAAQSDLRNAFFAAKTFFTDEETYVGLDESEMEMREPSLSYVSLAEAAEDVVAVGEATDTEILLVTQSSSGTWFCIAENIELGTDYGQGATFEAVGTTDVCRNAEPWDDGSGESNVPVAEIDDEPDPEIEDVEEIDLGPEPEVEPIERMLNAARTRDIDLFYSAFPAPDCELPDEMFEYALDPAMLNEPYKADVESTGPDSATVTASDNAGTVEEIEVVRDGGTWLMDIDLCEAAEETTTDQAQLDLRNALVAAKTYYTDEESYAALTPAELALMEPSLEYADLAGAVVGVVGVGERTDNVVILVSESPDGQWYCIADDVNVGTTYGIGGALEDVDTAAECSDGSW